MAVEKKVDVTYFVTNFSAVNLKLCTTPIDQFKRPELQTEI